MFVQCRILLNILLFNTNSGLNKLPYVYQQTLYHIDFVDSHPVECVTAEPRIMSPLLAIVHSPPECVVVPVLCHGRGDLKYD
jgi:hypothetical protein